MVFRETYCTSIGKLVVDTVCIWQMHTSFFQSLSTIALVFHQLHFLYSIILCNFSSSHSPTGLQMLNLALIPKQQEFESPSSLTHKITFHPQTTFHSSQTCTQKSRERKAVSHNHFIKYTPTAILWTQCEPRRTLVPGQKWAAKQQGQHKNRNFMDNPPHL